MNNKMVIGALAAAALTGAVGSAAAIETTFTGSTDGCFGSGCVLSNTATLGGLTYRDSTFNVTTAGGFAAVGAQAAVPNLNNLGSFALTGAPFTYTGNSFDLLVSFTAPTAVNTRIVAALTGTVTAADHGGVLIDFDNTKRTFGFLPAGSSFDFSVNDVSITAGAPPVSVTGQITSRQVPGPIAGAGLPALMALGGLVWARRRKATAAA